MIGWWSMIAVSLFTAQQPEPYAWPLELPRALTSSCFAPRRPRLDGCLSARLREAGSSLGSADTALECAGFACKVAPVRAGAGASGVLYAGR